MNEQAHIKAVEAVADAIQNEVPFPHTMPTPVDIALVDQLREKLTEIDGSIEDLQKAIADMQSRLREYQRAKARCLAAIDADVKTEVIEG